MKNEHSTSENVKIELPVQVEHQVLNELLKQKFQGKVLSKGMENGTSIDQAKIEEIHLQKNSTQDFALTLKLRLRLLTTIFRNKTVEMLIHISPEFCAEEQVISIQKYEVDGMNNGWIINNLLESLINSFLYNKLKNKMKFNLQPLLQGKVSSFNQKLLTGIEIKEGIILSGEIEKFRIEKLIFGEDGIIAFLDLTGNNEIKIQKLDF